MYDLRRKHKTLDKLTPEEYEVSRALSKAGYKRSYEHEHYLNFIPTSILFTIYRRYISGLRFRMHDMGAPDDLSTRQFGAALCRAMDLGPDQKVRRQWHGKRFYGYLGLTGPEVIKSHDSTGRPLIRDIKGD